MVPSYFAGLFGCIWLLPYLTSNRHDWSLEAAMTGAFVFGPLAAICGFVVGAVMTKAKKRRSSSTASGADE
jgi:hypothetical protein